MNMSRKEEEEEEKKRVRDSLSLIYNQRRGLSFVGCCTSSPLFVRFEEEFWWVCVYILDAVPLNAIFAANRIEAERAESELGGESRRRNS